MATFALLDQVFGGRLSPVSCPTEAEYRRAWLDLRIGDAGPAATALFGGAIADRLAWVFLAGYQGCIRHTFPGVVPDPSWAAFVNMEDPSEGLPPTRLTGGPDSMELTGWKTWVAASDHVDWLLVSARQGQTPFVILNRDTAGVTIETGPLRGYLSELTQGRVHFAGVDVRPPDLVGDDLTFPVFRASESSYVRCALNAFMLSHLVRLGAPPGLLGDAVEGILSAAGLVGLPMPSATVAVGLLGVDRRSSALAAEFEAFIGERDPSLHALWLKDRRLVSGASRMITERARIALGVPQDSLEP